MLTDKSEETTMNMMGHLISSQTRNIITCAIGNIKASHITADTVSKLIVRANYQLLHKGIVPSIFAVAIDLMTDISDDIISELQKLSTRYHHLQICGAFNYTPAFVQ